MMYKVRFYADFEVEVEGGCEIPRPKDRAIEIAEERLTEAFNAEQTGITGVLDVEVKEL